MILCYLVVLIDSECAFSVHTIHSVMQSGLEDHTAYSVIQLFCCSLRTLLSYFKLHCEESRDTSQYERQSALFARSVDHACAGLAQDRRVRDTLVGKKEKAGTGPRRPARISPIRAAALLCQLLLLPPP